MDQEEKQKRFEAMKAIRDELVGFATSPLFEYRTKNGYFPVVGEGSHFARVMFVGEAPGETEAKTGKPFCGASGRVLDECFAHIGMPRLDAYVTNIVKDRPPGNRDPELDEILLYSPFLDRQIEIIQPHVIATLGRFSMDYIMKKFNRGTDLRAISKIHGQVFEVEAPYGKIKILPLYHPAATIYNRATREDLFRDFEKLKTLIND
ncbi:uracil-DNA glycosylase [Candidatus Microgenomates bacterium]|nr:uracil-DNA glycosylase [Candidatus Microgenomates bacterium]